MAYTIPPDTIIAGDTTHITDHNNMSDVFTGMFGGRYNVLNTAFAGGADPTGVTDSTAAINAALLAAPAGYEVYLPPGTYQTTGPINMPPMVRLRGARSVAAAGDVQNQSASVLQPASTWTTTQTMRGVISLLDVQASQAAGVGPGGAGWPSYSGAPGGNPGANICDIIIDGSVGPATLDGIAAYGAITAVTISGVGMNLITGIGIDCVENPSSTAGDKSADGWHVSHCILQNITSTGVWRVPQDSTFIDVHTQATGGDGFYCDIGNIRLIGCRADYGLNGYNLNPYSTGGGTGVSLIGCGTENNANNGCYIFNASGTGTTSRAPVLISGCSFETDGANGGAGGGGYAGIMIAGSNTVTIDGTNVLANATSPEYGIATTSIGTGPGVPDYVSVSGGFVNGLTAAFHDGAPAVIFEVSPGTGYYSGGEYVDHASTPASLYGAAPFGSKPAAPTGTVSTTLVMMGLGSTWTYTPTGSGTVIVTVTGTFQTNTGLATVTLGGRYGTGTAPANGAAVTGTRWGSPGDPTVRASGTGEAAPFSQTDLLTLTAGTAYWFDIALASGNASYTAIVGELSIVIAEQ